MTVASGQSRKTFAGNGVTTSFATSPVVFFETDNLVIYVTDDDTGVSETLVENTDYTVSGGDGSTGTVSLAGGSSPYGAPATGSTLVINRVLDIVQESDFVQNDGSDAEVQEDALDRLTMIAQQLETRQERSLSIADSDVSGIDTELPTATAGGILRVNVAGDAFEFIDADPESEADLFTQTGTGAAPRTWTSKVSENISPEDFGCVGDGTTDDSANMTLAAAAATGKRLKLTPGKTYLLAAVTIPASTSDTIVDMYGATVKSKVLAAATGSPIFNVTGTGRAIFVGGLVDGQKSSQPADGFSDSYNGGANGTGRAYRAAIKADATVATGVTEVIVRDVHFKNVYGSPVATLDVPRVTVRDCFSETCNFELAFAYWSASSSLLDFRLLNNIIDTPASGHASVNANGAVCSNYRRVLVQGNACYNAERNLCKIEGGRNISVVGNLIDTNTVDDFSGIQVSVTSSLATSRVVIANNDFFSVSRGISVTVASGQPDDVTITGNNIYTTKGTTVGDAIAVDTVTNLTISGNNCVDILRHGILVGGTSERVKIANNNLYGKGTAASQAILCTASTGSWGTVSIHGNHCAHFSETTLAGVLALTRSAAFTFGFASIMGNTVLAASTANYGIHIPDDCVLAGMIHDNYVDGQVNHVSSPIDTRHNTVTGTANLPQLSFTPSLRFGGGTSGITYAASGQIGRYRRDGNRIYYQIYLALSSKGSSTGNATVAGLPVASKTQTNGYAMASVFSTKITATAVGALQTQNTTVLDLANIVSGAAFAALQDTAFANDSSLVISGMYEVADNG